jgi:acetyltransferase-like isoleucine patch superfamily enzyme
VPHGGTIGLGRNVKLLSSRRANLIQLNGPCALMLARPTAEIAIGDDSAMSGAVVVAANSVRIGRRVQVGANALVIDTDGHPLSPELRRAWRGKKVDAVPGVAVPISIGDDVWIGTNVIVLKGTRLGDGCTVSAGAVISGEFPPRSLITGNPGRVVARIPPFRGEAAGDASL